MEAYLKKLCFEYQVEELSIWLNQYDNGILNRKVAIKL